MTGSGRERGDLRIRTGTILGMLMLAWGLEVTRAVTVPPPWRIDFALVAILLLAWRGRPLQAAFLGCLFGLAQDMASGGLLGLSGLSKTLIGFVVCHASWRISTRPPGLNGILCLGLVGLERWLTLAVLFLVGRRSVPVTWENWLITGALTGVFAELATYLFRRWTDPEHDFRRRL
ncbi:MAG: hypothetical protein Kow00109_27650 [Acidobacteriota bacterium]